MHLTVPSLAHRLTLAAAALLTLGGCAQIPRSEVADSRFPALNCVELAHQADTARATLAAANQAKAEAWHAVLPFVVAARYADASAAANDAQRRLDLLALHSRQRSCPTAPASPPAAAG